MPIKVPINYKITQAKAINIRKQIQTYISKNTNIAQAGGLVTQAHKVHECTTMMLRARSRASQQEPTFPWVLGLEVTTKQCR